MVEAELNGVMDVDPIDVSADGGVLKRVLLEGTGLETPPKESTVYVHYVGTLESDGTEFDSSRKRGEPFSFKLGTGSVIKGWDLGVATMKKGEKAILTCRGDYAYGKAGSPPTIPPNATLNFEVELLRWVDGEDISGDGEVVLKRVAGTKGWKHPKAGEKATIKYKAVRPDGAVFVDQWDSPVEVVVDGDASVPAAVHMAVRNMAAGETVRVTSSGRHAGEDGPVAFDVELVGYRETVKVTDDGAITKIILRQGEGYQTPNEGATVTLLIGEGEGAGMEERVVVVGEGQLPDAVDQAVLKMKKGERAQLVVAPQAQDVDAEAVVDGNKVWELEVTGFEKAKDAWSMTPDEKIAAADRLKGLGTEFFKRGHVRKAMRCYARGAKFVEAEAAGMDADQAAQRKELHTALSLNLALCCNKAAMYRDAVKHCDAVLAGDEANFKALSRRGVAYAGLGEYEAARADLQRAVDLDPSDKAVRRELAAVAMKIKKQEEREKAVFAKLFA